MFINSALVLIHDDLEHYILCMGLMVTVLCVFITLMQDENHNTSMMEACYGGHVETARVLLEHRAIVNHRNKVMPSIKGLLSR